MKPYEKISLIFALIIAVVIFYVSSLSFPPTPLGVSYTSLIYHFGIFFLFGFFVLMSLTVGFRNFIFSLLFCGVYAALDEVHQFYVPGRVASFSDFGIDCSGVLFGILVAFFLVDFFKN